MQLSFRLAGEGLSVQGKEGKKNAGIDGGFNPGRRVAAVEVLQQFIPEPRRWAVLQHLAIVADRLPGPFLDAEIIAGGVADRPDHPDGIAVDATFRIADHADDRPVQILDAVDVIDDGLVTDVEKKAVDRQVTALRIFGHRPERIVGGQNRLRPFQVVFVERPQGRDLDDLAMRKIDLDQPEPSADDGTVGKELADLARSGIGADVEILGLLAKVEVADAASDEIAGKTGCVEFFQDMEGIAVDHLERDRMLPRR